ncbi:MAG: hypothetical protein WD651_13290 [Acidimicrobiia bacterium]
MTAPGTAAVRRALGSWGKRLSDDKLVRAVIGAGVLEANPHLNDDDPAATLRNYFLNSDWSLGWRFPQESLARLTPQQAAKAAAGALGSLAVEPEIGSQPDPYTTMRFLGSAAAPYVRAGEIYEPSWHWPLRVGFLSDRPSSALRKSVTRPWPDLRDLVKAQDDCDLLLLPWSVSEADQKNELPQVGKVGMVMLMGPIDVPSKEVGRVADRLALRFGAEGCHLANRPEDPEQWFADLIEQLAHNQPLGLALTLARNNITRRPHYTTMSSGLGTVARLERVISQFAYYLTLLGGRPIEIPAGLGGRLPSFDLSGSVPAGAVGDYLNQAMRDRSFQYLHETNEASAIAALVRATAGLPSPGELATANGGGRGAGEGGEGGEQIRILNGKVMDGDKQHRLALEAGKEYGLEVWIGVMSEESITQPGAPAFPAEELPAGPQQIDVVFTCLGNRPEVQRGQVTLPERGDSDRFSFVLRFTRPGVVFGRLALAHGGRVLQTAVVRAEVVKERPSRLGQPEIEVEEVIRTSFGAVAEEEQFDLAVVVNRGPTGKKTAATISKDAASLRSIDGLQAQITDLKDALTSIADDPDAFASITSKESLALLFGLSNAGAVLHKSFEIDHGIKPGLFKRGRIQIISAAPDSYLPVELLYALRPPDVPRLCKNWKKSVLAGKCESCEALGPNDEIPICLTGFWGVRYVVERHVHDPTHTGMLGDYVLQSELAAGRNEINPLESILWGLSKNVLAKDRTALQRAFSKKNFAATKVGTWKDLQEKMGPLNPSMLFLLPHTEHIAPLVPGSEIGGKLDKINKIPDFVGPRREKRYVVVLLGCDTASTDIPFQGMVPQFRYAGAAVIVTTINTILGRHAVPVAKELLRILKDGGIANRSMGDAMRDLRRQALSDGYPMVLSVVAFGDADWRITA